MEQKTEASQAVDELLYEHARAIMQLREYGHSHDRAANVRAAEDAIRAAIKAQPAPTEAPTKPTMMPNDEALTWAWKSLRKDLGDERWTTGDSCTYFGFFCWGWRYRTQYEKQKTTEAAQVTVEQGGVYITKGVQSFRLAYEGETQAEKEWYAGQLRAALAQGEDSARLDFFAPVVLDPACGCAKCNPRAAGRMMILCATCGNKRCPHATDHALACTNSNEPGKVGSSYGPATPQPQEQP